MGKPFGFRFFLFFGLIIDCFLFLLFFFVIRILMSTKQQQQRGSNRRFCFCFLIFFRSICLMIIRVSTSVVWWFSINPIFQRRKIDTFFFLYFSYWFFFLTGKILGNISDENHKIIKLMRNHWFGIIIIEFCIRFQNFK